MLDSMDSSTFKIVFDSAQYLRGECAYLKSDACSNFIRAKNDRMMEVSSKEPDQLVRERHDYWKRQGYLKDINPPLASIFGGV